MNDSARESSASSALDSWGFSDGWPEELAKTEGAEGGEPGRVVFASREIYRVVTAAGKVDAGLTGRLREQGELPAVGDWVVLEKRDQGRAVVSHILHRRTCLSRKVPGEVTREQVVAANVDTVFLVMGLDSDFNLRRFERLGVMAWESGAQPVGVLTKADLVEEVAERRLDAQTVLPGAPALAVSSVTGQGLEALRAFLVPTQTIALIGSSGAGKSTLLNALFGEAIMRTAEVRASDQRGRHTTTHRQLVPLPGGALLIDNPGIREIQLWAEDGALAEAFEDVEELAGRCRFRDCRHRDEPGCAVRRAVEEGALERPRLESWRELQRELDRLAQRRDVAGRRREDRRLGRLYKRIQAEKSSRRGS